MNRKGIAPLFVVIALAIASLAAVGTAYIVSSRKSITKSEAKTGDLSRQLVQEFNDYPSENSQNRGPKLTPFPTRSPRSSSTPKPVSTPNPGLIKSETGTTDNGWAYTGYRDVLVDVITSSDKHTLYIDFEHENFNTTDSISYKLTYKKADGTSVGVEGSMKPTDETLLSKSNGNKYIRREISLSSCSKEVCTYHENSSDFSLVVVSKRINSTTTYEQRLTKQSL